MVEAFNAETDDNLPALNCLMALSICPAGLITPLSWQLLRTFNACGGTERVATPEEYYRLSAIYVDACSVIESEKSKHQVTNGDK